MYMNSVQKVDVGYFSSAATYNLPDTFFF